MLAAVVEMSAAVSRNLGIFAYFNSAKPGFRRAGSETSKNIFPIFRGFSHYEI
jgi:hypothetical protein